MRKPLGIKYYYYAKTTGDEHGVYAVNSNKQGMLLLSFELEEDAKQCGIKLGRMTNLQFYPGGPKIQKDKDGFSRTDLHSLL